MTATTFDRAGTARAQRTGKGFIRRFMDHYMEVQMKRAQLRVNAYLRGLGDGDLQALGYTPAEIRAIRNREASISVMV